MVPTIAKLTTLALLLALPVASAAGINGGDPPSSPDVGGSGDGGDSGSGSEGGNDGGSDGGSDGGWLGAGDLSIGGAIPSVGVVLPGIGDVAAAAGELVSSIDALIPCQQAVRVDRHWYSAHVTDTRDGVEAWRETDWYPITHYRQVPVTPESSGIGAAPVTQTLGWAPVVAGISARDSPTVYVTEAYDVMTSVPVTVEAAWTQNFYHWMQHQDSFVLSLAAGAPFLADGTGHMIDSCDVGAPLVTYIPDPYAPGAVAYCWHLCRWAPSDGWYGYWTDYSARLTTLADKALPYYGDHTCRWNWSCGELWSLIHGLSPTLADFLFQERELSGVVTPQGSTTATEAVVEPMAAETAGAIPMVGILAGIAALAAAGAGAWAYARRK